MGEARATRPSFLIWMPPYFLAPLNNDGKSFKIKPVLEIGTSKHTNKMKRAKKKKKKRAPLIAKQKSAPIGSTGL